MMNPFNYVEAVAPETDGVSVEGGKWFYVVLPPCTMTSYTVTIADTYGEELVKEITTPVTISRSSVVLLGAFEADGIPTIPRNNQICYTAMCQLNFAFGTVDNHRYDPVTRKGCVTFSTTITEIPEFAYFNSTTHSGDTSITSITLPASVTSIGESAFERCSNLTSVSIPGVQIVEKNAFNNCNIQTLKLPAIQRLGYSAFGQNRQLQSVELGSNIDLLDSFAFANSTALSVVKCSATSCPAYDDRYLPFYGGLTDDAVLHVPQDRRDAYSAWSGWFSEIEDDLPLPSNK